MSILKKYIPGKGKSEQIVLAGNRREFLKKSALAGIAVALVPVMNTGCNSPDDTDKITSGSSDSANNSLVTFLITADIHAQLNTHDEFFWENNQSVYRRRGGLAVLKTMIESYRKQNPVNTVLYDGGDYFHGHAVASLTEGVALIPIFNKLGYDLILPGNWEVVYKKKKMLYDLGHSNAAKICANMFHDNEAHTHTELVYPPFWIKYVGGIKIGVIGYTDHLTPKRQSPAYSVGLLFEHANESVAKYVKELRENEGCEVVMVATHMGLAQQIALADHPAVEGVDLIIGADTHERVRKPIQGKYSKVIECGAFGSFLGKLDIHLENGKFKKFSYELLDVDPEKYAPDKEIEGMIAQASAPFLPDIQKVIGTSTTPLVRYFVLETPMDNLITDAIMWKFKPDVALSNGFRFCQPLAVDPATKQAAITKEFLWNMLPVNSEAKSGMVTGAQIKDWLEKELHNAFAKNAGERFGGWFVRFNGMEVNFTIGNDEGNRLNYVKINNQPIDDDKEYKIIACEREGDPDTFICRMENVKNPTRLNLLMHDVIEEYLAVRSPVSPVLEGRATATDAPPTLLTQLQNTTYEFS